MNAVEPFTLYAAAFPFIESDSSKIRPVIIASQAYGKHKLMVAIPVSSQIKTESVDSIIHQWQDAGLLKPSVARVHRLTSLRQANLKAKLGDLTEADVKQLKDSLRNLLKLA